MNLPQLNLHEEHMDAKKAVDMRLIFAFSRQVQLASINSVSPPVFTMGININREE